MIRIVKAEKHHIPDICKLWLEFMQFHRDIDVVFTPRDGATKSFEEEYLQRLMTMEDGLVLVAMDGEKVIGFSLSEIRNTRVFELKKLGAIDTIAVTEGYRRRGVGEKLLSETLKWFKLRGISRVELEVAVKNRVGYSFWKKQGFNDYRHRLYKQI